MPIILASPADLLAAPAPPQADVYQVVRIAIMDVEEANPVMQIDVRAGLTQPDTSINWIWNHTYNVPVTNAKTFYTNMKNAIYTHLQSKGVFPAGAIT